MHATRRQRLLDSLGDGLLVLPTAPHTLRNGDVHHSFRPGSDLFYLTGFGEPDSVLVAWRTGKGGHRSVLFVPPRDKTREIWDGPRAGVKGAVKDFGVDEAYPIGDLWTRLPDLLLDHGRVFCTLFVDAAFDARIQDVFARVQGRRRRANAPVHPVIEDPRPALARMRLCKDKTEIAAMDRAAAATAAGHRAAMTGTRRGMFEYEVQALVESEFRRQGSPRNGYDSIVASGANACVLHYVQNDRKIRANELMLIDAGAEVDGYTADITRTYPVSGTFTDTQRAVYAAVLRAQKAGIRAVKPGAAWNAPHRTCIRVLTQELVKLGVLKGDPKALIEKQAYRPFYMHGTSHWLGMDVHDVGPYEEADGKPVRFAPGMVLTVEPGLYFGRTERAAPKEFRGIGVRIEDDVLVTKTGHRVLTDGVPKDIREVEALCREAKASR